MTPSQALTTSAGPRLFTGRDDQQTAEEIARFSQADARRYAEYEAFLARLASFVEPWLLTTPPDVLRRTWGDLWQLGRRDCGDSCVAGWARSARRWPPLLGVTARRSAPAWRWRRSWSVKAGRAAWCSRAARRSPHAWSSRTPIRSARSCGSCRRGTWIRSSDARWRPSVWRASR